MWHITRVRRPLRCRKSTEAAARFRSKNALVRNVDDRGDTFSWSRGSTQRTRTRVALRAIRRDSASQAPAFLGIDVAPQSLPTLLGAEGIADRGLMAEFSLEKHILKDVAC